MNVREELEKLKGKTAQETMVRVAPEAHKMLIELSAKHGVSMRQLVTLGVKLLYEQEKESDIPKTKTRGVRETTGDDRGPQV